MTSPAGRFMERGTDRRGGSALVLIVIFMVFLFSLAAALTMASVGGLRVSRASETGTRAFYLADSGAQAGIARVRAGNGNASPQTFTEDIAGGRATVAIEKPSAYLYRIRSTGTYLDQERRLEVYIEYRTQFSLSGAVTAMVGSGVELEDNLPIDLLGASRISGYDHLAVGTLSTDQGNAVHGLTLNKVGGKKNFTFTGTGVAEGVPGRSDNRAAYMGATLSALRDHAKAYAAVRITGSKVLGTADTGLYGTAAAPKLVYVRLNDSNYLEMNGSFAGHGTLVVDAEETDSVNTLRLKNLASWNGLVLVYFREDTDVDSGGAVIRLRDDARIVGALSLMFNGDEVDIDGSGKLIQASERASILFSSSLIDSAPGTSAVSSTRTAEVTAYRRL